MGTPNNFNFWGEEEARQPLTNVFVICCKPLPTRVLTIITKEKVKPMRVAVLTRKKTEGKAVLGTMEIPYNDATYLADTIENADFLIPEGEYVLDITWSPKFKKPLPQIMDVPDRDGIRIHMGTKPEHSTGCILVNFRAMQIVNSFIKVTQYLEEDEKAILRIT